MEVSTKIHAGAGRLQATVDAGLSLGFEHQLAPAQIVECEVGIPRVVQGRLTQNDPPDLQSAQLSIPFSLAMALGLGRTRGAQASLRSTDYDLALKDSNVRALSNRTRCVLDPWVEAGTNTEEVPTRVTIKLASGVTQELKIEHPRGSPHRRMAWDELTALFCDTLGDALPADRLDKVQKLVAGLDSGSSVRELMNTFVAMPGWLEQQGNSV
jgi:2-methylcitrate dehydratase PrpD